MRKFFSIQTISLKKNKYFTFTYQNLYGKHFNIHRSFVFYLIFFSLSLAERHSHTERILEDVEMVSLQKRKMIKVEILKLFIPLHHLVHYEPWDISFN